MRRRHGSDPTARGPRRRKWHELREQRDQTHRERDSRNAAGRGQQQPLGQLLTDQALGAGP